MINIKKLLKEFSSSQSPFHKEIRRHISWAINLIPVFGSLLDANTIKRIEEYELEKKLLELDRKCSLALNSNRNEIKMHLETIDQFVFENEFNRVLQYSPLNLLSTEEYSSDIIKKSLFALGLNPLKEFQKEKSLIFLISGPSAVGKDAVLNPVFDRLLQMDIRAEYLTKYTNRKKKNSDLEYYKFLSDSKFDSLERNNSLILYEFKYGHKYGFDSNHLKEAAKTGTIMFAVYTDLRKEKFKNAIRELNQHSFAVCSILLNSEFVYLKRRTRTRGLSPEEQITRMTTAEKESKYIQSHFPQIKQQFSFIIDNNDKIPIERTINTVYNIVWITTQLYLIVLVKTCSDS